METRSTVAWEIILIGLKIRYWVGYPITISSLWNKQRKNIFARDRFVSFYAKELDRVITACTHWSHWGLGSSQPPCRKRMKKAITTRCVCLNPWAEALIMHYYYGLIRLMGSWWLWFTHCPSLSLFIYLPLFSLAPVGISYVHSE